MRGEEAYDFSLFETHAEQPLAAEPKPSAPDNVIEMPASKQQKRERARLHRHPLRIAAFSFGLLVMVGVMGAFVYGQVQLSNLAVATSQQESKLREEQSLYTQLQMKSDAKQSLSSVEEAAKKKLGMNKVDPSQMETVEMNGSDKAQVVQKTATDPLSQLWERVCSLLS